MQDIDGSLTGRLLFQTFMCVFGFIENTGPRLFDPESLFKFGPPKHKLEAEIHGILLSAGRRRRRTLRPPLLGPNRTPPS